MPTHIILWYSTFTQIYTHWPDRNAVLASRQCLLHIIFKHVLKIISFCSFESVGLPKVWGLRHNKKVASWDYETMYVSYLYYRNNRRRNDKMIGVFAIGTTTRWIWHYNYLEQIVIQKGSNTSKWVNIISSLWGPIS